MDEINNSLRQLNISAPAPDRRNNRQRSPVTDADIDNIVNAFRRYPEHEATRQNIQRVADMPDLSARHAVLLLNTHPSIRGAGIRNAIANMSAHDLYGLNPAAYQKLSVQKRAQALANRPNLSVNEAKLFIEINPHLKSQHVDLVIGNISAHDLLELNPKARQRLSVQKRAQELADSGELLPVQLLQLMRIKPNLQADIIPAHNDEFTLSLISRLPNQCRKRPDIKAILQSFADKESSFTGGTNHAISIINQLSSANNNITSNPINNFIATISADDIGKLYAPAMQRNEVQNRAQELAQRLGSDPAKLNQHTCNLLKANANLHSDTLHEGIATLSIDDILVLPEQAKKRADIQSHIQTLVDRPNLSINQAYYALCINPKLRSPAIENAVAQMPANLICILPEEARRRADVQRRMPECLHELANPPETRLEHSSSFPPMLSHFAVSAILSVDQNFQSEAISNTIEKMSLNTIYQFLPKKAHRRDDVQARLREIADRPDLATDELKLLLKLAPDIKGGGIPLPLKLLSQEEQAALPPSNQHVQDLFIDRASAVLRLAGNGGIIDRDFLEHDLPKLPQELFHKITDALSEAAALHRANEHTNAPAAQ